MKPERLPFLIAMDPDMSPGDLADAALIVLLGHEDIAQLQQGLDTIASVKQELPRARGLVMDVGGPWLVRPSNEILQAARGDGAETLSEVASRTGHSMWPLGRAACDALEHYHPSPDLYYQTLVKPSHLYWVLEDHRGESIGLSRSCLKAAKMYFAPERDIPDLMRSVVAHQPHTALWFLENGLSPIQPQPEEVRDLPPIPLSTFEPLLASREREIRSRAIVALGRSRQGHPRDRRSQAR